MCFGPAPSRVLTSSRMPRHARIAALAAVALVLLVVAVMAMPGLLAGRAGAPAAALAPDEPKPPASVLVHVVKAEGLTESISTTGTLRADEQIEVTSEIAGQVKDVSFDEGTAVAEGRLLVQIDDDELRAQHDRAAHRVALAASREERQARLLEDGVVSPQAHEILRGELDVARAELALVTAQLAKTRIRAPFAGVVGLRHVSPGARVAPGTRITTLQRVDPIKVEFSVPERHADRLRVGQAVSLAVAGVDGRFDATIYAMEPAVDPPTRSLTVRARLPNPGHRLRPGQFADVSLVIAESPAALTVPSIAVIPELGGKRVMLVDDGVVTPRPVTTGIRTEDRVEVTEGLAAGDLVIVGGIERVRPGDRATSTEVP